MKMIRRAMALFLLTAMLLTQTVLAAPAVTFTDELTTARHFANLLQQGETTLHANLPAAFDYTLCYRYLSMIYRDGYVFEYIPTPNSTYMQITYNDAAKHGDAEAEAARLARQLLRPEMREEEKYRAIYEYLLSHVEYDMHAALNQQTERGDSFSAYGALLGGQAVCDGITAAFSMICRAAGLPCIYVASPEMNHSWNAVWLDGEVRYIDITYDLTGGTHKPYFLLSAHQLARDHRWDRAMTERLTAALWDERYISAYTLNAMGGLFRGTDKGYELDRKPTRAEAAIMLVRFLGLEQAALKGSTGMHMPFTDVNPNHAPYIAMLYALGLTRGTSETTFSPNVEVQARDYMTFMLRVLEYAEGAGDFRWQTAVEDSLRLGVLTEGEHTRLTTAPFDRGRMAEVSLTVLQAEKQDGEVLVDALIRDGVLSEKKVLEFIEKY